MKNYRTLLISVLVLLQGACTLGGVTQPSRFYLLSADAAAPALQPASAKPVSLVIDAVSLPDIVDRPQIVTRLDANRIQLSEFDRWAGDLKENLVSVLAQNLMAQLNTQDIAYFPAQSAGHPDFRITLRFFRFDGRLGEQVRIAGVWQLLDGREGCRIESQGFDITETPAGSGYAEFVSAMSAGVAKLSESIAGRVAAATPGCNVTGTE
ncbi:MAG: membrane integrity-associated transporter subunit PqiC [Thiogranum sp.]|nr:membrane integrity-associated transporter subunit PqiC [Thiogranum sp.]